jgi:hypothetical protein
MKRMTCILLLALAGLAILPQTALAGQFKNPVYYTLNDVPYGVVTADFNNDGNLDLAVADWFTGHVAILLGKGNGKFDAPRYFPVTLAYALAAADFNGDHKLDLAVVQYGGTGQSALSIYLGNGDGSFHRSATYALGVEATSIAIADFNGDGKLDLAVTNEGGQGGNGSVMVFFGKGDGTFSLPTTYNLPGYPDGVAAADLDGDGHPDLAVAQYNVGVTILLNTGQGKFRKAGVYKVAAARSVNIAELKHDAIPDLVVTSFQAVAVLLGKGGGKFRRAVYYSTKLISHETNPYAAVVADFNLDGNPDIVTVLTGTDAALFYGTGDGTFGMAVRIKGVGGEGIATGDFNHDGAPDLAVDNAGIGIAVLINAQ